MKKLILIGPVYPYKGGISHYTSLLYRALSKKYDVEMISYKMQYPSWLYKKEQKDFSNNLFQIEGTKFLLHTANPFNIIRVGWRIRKEKPGMVIMQWWHPYFAPCYWILESVLGKKIQKMFICHNVFPHERFPMDKLLTKLVLKGGDAFIVHSQSDGEDLRKIRPDANYAYNPHPTYNAFKLRNLSKEEARKELQLQEDEKVLLFFGFVREYKGLKHLLNAMPQVKEELKKVKLLIVGTFGDDKEDYMQLICEKKIEDCVRVIDGYTPDHEVEKYFAACDLVVCPYESATQSGIVQIAFGFEKPVVATNVGGLPDVVEDRKTGYVVEPRNPAEIANAIIDFYANNRSNVLAKEINEEKYKYSWEGMEHTIGKLFEKNI